ncbi:hypothetical protein BY996DRAFT_6417395 [Phakopsora pachyrhizi]|uniref:Expressed protein n=1 Tax=Phakopsora pachyrhizi TaxID=170000 RepID=A0AAV0AEM1_PHAPC|nr:hypothetical protein BY996DRAFT_6417395 [Phakopsora pachyrhizi]CAH7666540.1 expressed protein [Phakopsora pachyrhizi]
MINPSTPGTLVVLLGAGLLTISTFSTPIIKDIFFLSAKVRATVSSATITGTLTLGTLGYCIELGTQLACSSPSIGYDLSAGLALISAILGFISHFREYSQSCLTSFITSLAATAAFLAFVFDIVAFTIAKSRISQASTTSASTEATLGKAIWITLGGWLCLACSGIFFCMGRCIIRRKRSNQAESAALRPSNDNFFASQMRQDAVAAEEAKKRNLSSKPQNSIPTFAEFGSEYVVHERIPLAHFEESKEEDRLSDQQSFRSHIQGSNKNLGAINTYAPSAARGYHESINLYRADSLGGASNYSQASQPYGPQEFQNRGILSNQLGPNDNIYSNLPPHIAPSTNSMNVLPQISRPAYPQTLLPTEGSNMSLRAQLSGDDRYFIPSTSSRSPVGQLMYPTYDRPEFAQPTQLFSHRAEKRSDAYSGLDSGFANRQGPGYAGSQNSSSESSGKLQFGSAQFNPQFTSSHNVRGDPYGGTYRIRNNSVDDQVYVPEENSHSTGQDIYHLESTQFDDGYNGQIQQDYNTNPGQSEAEFSGHHVYYPNQFPDEHAEPIKLSYSEYSGQAIDEPLNSNHQVGWTQPANNGNQHRSNSALQPTKRIDEIDSDGGLNSVASQLEEPSDLTHRKMTSSGEGRYQDPSNTTFVPLHGYR